MDTRRVLDMHQLSDNDLALTSVSKAIKLLDFDRSIGDMNNNPIEIGINIHGASGDLAGNIEGVCATAAGDIAEASTKWSPIEGGDLSQWVTTGICTVIKAPYTHIRVKPTAGSCKMALTSSTPIKEV